MAKTVKLGCLLHLQQESPNITGSSENVFSPVTALILFLNLTKAYCHGAPQMDLLIFFCQCVPATQPGMTMGVSDVVEHPEGTALGPRVQARVLGG